MRSQGGVKLHDTEDGNRSDHVDVLRKIVASACSFFQAEDGIRDIGVTGVQTCSSDLEKTALLDKKRASKKCNNKRVLWVSTGLICCCFCLSRLAFGAAICAVLFWECWICCAGF